MSSFRRKTSGLAARIVRVTLTVGIMTVVTAGTVTLVNTFQLAAEKAEGRGVKGAQTVEDGVEARLREVQVMLDRVTEEAATTTKTAEAKRGIEDILDQSGDLLDQAYISEIDGEVIAAFPASSTDDVSSLQSFAVVRTGHSGFFILAAEDRESQELWFGRTSLTARGIPIVTLARVNSDFLDEVLDEVAQEASDRAVMILEGDQIIRVATDQPPLDMATAQWKPESESSGNVSLLSARGRRMSGQYNDIQGIEGLTWRVVIVEPSGHTFDDTVHTLTPSAAVLLVGSIIGLIAAWMLSQRLARPLRELERAARSAAAGSYVGALNAESDDEIGRVAEAFNAVALRLNALHDLAQLLASASRIDQVLDRILSAMEHLVGPGAAAIYLLDAAGERLVPAQTRGFDLADVVPVRVAKGEWLAEALFSTGAVEKEGSPDEIETALPGITGAHTAALSAPLMAGNDPLGVVVVLRDGGSPVSDAEREMVRTFSAQAAVAVQNSRLFEEESHSRQIAEALKSVAEELVNPEGLEIALHRVEEIVRELLGASLARIIVVDRRVLGLPAESDRVHDQEMLAAGLRVLSRSNGEVTSLGIGAEASVDTILHEYDAATLLVVPIALDTEHGAIMVVALDGRHAGEGVLSVAQALADEIALALDNSFFYERALNRAANLETIFRISQAVGSSLQVKVVLNRVLDVVQKILSADAVALLSYDARKRSLTTDMARGMVPQSVLHLEAGPGEDIPGHVFSSGQPVAIRDLHEDMTGIAGAAASNNLGSLLAVPLLARGRSIGVLMVFSAQRGAFSDEDLSVLQTFASQASLALDTARLYSREHDVASILQQSILPEALPDFPEVAAQSVYQPAGADTEIGGDYYDVFRGPDSEIWFAIADVCGKGVLAATKTSMIKYAVRSFAAAGLSPARVVAEVNRMTTEAGDPSDIVTLWLGRYDPLKGTLLWSDGGHPPGLLKRVDGTIERLGATGPLLGALSDALYEQETVNVGPGDRLVLYTDGVTEARRGNIFFGEERIREVLMSTETNVAQAILSAVREYVEGDLRDDVAVLSLDIRDGSDDSGGEERRDS